MLPGSRNSALGNIGRLANRRGALQLRARMIQAIRHYFITRGYLEVETPVLIPAPAPEVNIDAVEAGKGYLQTSPEICMKRLLSAGYDQIFQICRCFRQAERGHQHLPELTLLEWYHAQMDYKGLMSECESLIRQIGRDLGFQDQIAYQGKSIGLSGHWQRLTVSEAFESYAPLGLQESLDRGCFDALMVEAIEPNLGAPTPTFLYDYPASLGALARLKPEDKRFAERFELYMGGVELANAFSELRDEGEQRRRFEEEIKRREALGKPVYPMPEPFLEALSFMPDAAGIALGIDRLVMIFANKARIDDVVAFTPEEL
jgi:elongation factor P--(R)-beta-lysine ligase